MYVCVCLYVLFYCQSEQSALHFCKVSQLQLSYIEFLNQLISPLHDVGRVFSLGGSKYIETIGRSSSELKLCVLCTEVYLVVFFARVYNRRFH